MQAIEFEVEEPKRSSKEELAEVAARRIANSAKSIANARVLAARKRHAIRPYESWEDLKDDTNIPLNPGLQEFSSDALYEYLDLYASTAGLIARASLKAPAVAEKPVYRRLTDIDFGGFNHKPQQEKVLDFLIRALWVEKTTNAVLVPLDTGDGKGVIAAIISKWVMDKQVSFPGINNILIVTKKGVIDSTFAKLRRVGLAEEHIGTAVSVVGYNELSSQSWRGFFQEVTYKDSSENICKKFVYKGMTPDLVIVDEVQMIKKMGTKAFKKLESFIAAGSKFILTSATPAVTVYDNAFFALASKQPDHEGNPITREMWPLVAKQIAAPDDPKKPSDQAMRQFSVKFSQSICRPPKDPKKYKVFNSLVTEAMPDDIGLRNVYFNAEDDWLQAKANAGEKVTDRGAVMARFQIMRQAAEMLSVDIFVERMRATLAEGKACIIGVSFQATLREIALRAIRKGIITREQLSVIWGGKRDIRASEIYTDMEFVDAASRAENLTKEELKKLRLTQAYQIQRCRMNLSMEENEARTAELRSLRLFKQTPKERTAAMDDFQSGKTLVCIFTLASGGTGIDLDHQFTTARPRKVFVTTCYYAEEFLQALGRAARTATLTDVYQEIIVLAGTIAAQHVVPILRNKMNSLRTLVAGHMDLVLLMEKRATFEDLKETRKGLQKPTEVFVQEQEDEDIKALDEAFDDSDDDEEVEED